MSLEEFVIMPRGSVAYNDAGTVRAEIKREGIYITTNDGKEWKALTVVTGELCTSRLNRLRSYMGSNVSTEAK